MTDATPLRLEPILHPRIWGGTALRDNWGKLLPGDEPYGESWELTWRPEAVTRVVGGPFAGHTLDEVAARDHAGLVGTRLAGMPQFPLLAKLLDCRERLSVQVHPTVAYAEAHPPAEVKMEAWYVLDAPAGATLVFGLRPGTTRETFAAAVGEGRVGETLHEQPVRPGDVVLVKPGTVHALLEGLMVYEIQQSSDTTFRVYDWDRVDANGRPRDLHVDAALDCIDFAAPSSFIQPLELEPPDALTLLVATPAFALQRLRVHDTCGVRVDERRCELLTAIEGNGRIDGVEDPVVPGDSFLMPAGMGVYHLHGPLTVLRSFVPDWHDDVWGPARAAGHSDEAIRAACGGYGPEDVSP